MARSKTVISRFIQGILCVLAVAVLSILAAPIIHATGISSGYITNDSELRPGMMVGISAETIEGKPAVERARMSRANYIIGAAVNLEEELVTAVSKDAPQSFVVATGEADVYVIDLNGAVKKNDQLVISPVRGILMRADKGVKGVATALADFDETKASEIEVTSPNGVQKSKMAKNKVVIHAEVNQSAGMGNAYIDRIGEALGRKDLSEIQVLAALVIFVVILVIEGGLVYGSVSSAIKSIGRNPLSKKLIYAALARSFGIAFIILLLGVAVMFGVLWI